MDQATGTVVNFTGYEGKRSGQATLLPDPEPRDRVYRIISADDHLVEPPHLFDGRLPSRFADRTPKVVELDDGVGSQAWEIDGDLIQNVGFNAVVGRPREQMAEPTRFDEMRRGAWDIHARVKDMDLDGVEASVCFPSAISGFAGQRYSQRPDQDFGYALFQAWNDWHIEEWAGTYPGRIVPLQIGWLADPVKAAENIRTNAQRGFKAVSFPENPHPLGFPSLHTDYWDPFFRACEETDTVVCLHLGSSSTRLVSSPECIEEERMMLFPTQAQISAVEWIFSKVLQRFPRLQVVSTEGGISWVPMMIDRLAHYEKNFRDFFPNWGKGEPSPTELFRNAFWFCALNERSVLPIIDVIGVDRVLFEVDYPHADSIWPDSQATVADDFARLPREQVDKITYQNAQRLFRLEDAR